ncbi:cryptochrome/photolyase family protein [Alkalicoccus halolimnae]|uniref:Cryptochrome DASH n=1 Tax=Alkalicoccus halolimnae TaxID=1667239 RepID=A0A5C7FJL0_9BACI|nr:DASH family cryptochrome [Alkalicoccus halolimnae]TXF85606.1 DASH family cryptochrome [Alkalicoccus halolimnae]
MEFVWLRNDLRIHDHQPLVDALASGTPVMAGYVFDRKHDSVTENGFPRMDKKRRRFLIESLLDLHQQLGRLGVPLVTAHGDTAREIRNWFQQYPLSHVRAFSYPGVEEIEEAQAVEEAVRQFGSTLTLYEGETLFHETDLPFTQEEVPGSFSAYRKKIEKSRLLPRQEAGEPQEQTPLYLEDHAETGEELMKQFRTMNASTLVSGGEKEGLKRLNDYFFLTRHVLHYKERRNGLFEFDDSSKLSPWLANGSLSPRRVYWELKRFERVVEANKSTYWLFFELLWRDYFHMLLRKEKHAFFKKSGIQKLPVVWKQDAGLFEAWCTGKTGYPLVDASMRQLKATGYMSNRGRQNTAAFLTKNLGIDWRWGAAWFESQLIDYDAASNYGNWQYVAGVGTDATTFRIFDVVKQGRLFDPDGVFVRHWLPELQFVPNEYIYAPYEMEELALIEAALQLGSDYPYPLVPLEHSAEERRAEHEEARKIRDSSSN